MSRYQEDDAPPAFRVLRDCRAMTVTFGGKQAWTLKAGEKFYYNFVLEKNTSFTVVQSGLNYHVLETSAITEVVT